MSEIDENEFVDIRGYEGLYQINRKGEVKSLERYDEAGKLRKEKYLKPSIDSSYYYFVELNLNKKGKKIKIHKLLYNTFICDYDTKYFEIDHLDHNRQNNNLENLRLVSSRDNNNNRTDQSLFGCGVQINGKKYQSRILINSKNTYLGNFETPEEASKKYLYVKFQIDEIEKITRNYTFNRYKKDGEYFIEFFQIL